MRYSDNIVFVSHKMPDYQNKGIGNQFKKYPSEYTLFSET